MEKEMSKSNAVPFPGNSLTQTPKPIQISNASAKVLEFKPKGFAPALSSRKAKIFFVGENDGVRGSVNLLHNGRQVRTHVNMVFSRLDVDVPQHPVTAQRTVVVPSRYSSLYLYIVHVQTRLSLF